MPNRFWAKVAVDSSGCWLWRGGITGAGYGVAQNARGQHQMTHRWVYDALVAELPTWTLDDPMEVDHLCRNRLCCNPAHLELVSRRENLARMTGYSAPSIRSRLDHGVCKRGHRDWQKKPKAAGFFCATCLRDHDLNRKKLLRQAADALGMSRKQYTKDYGWSRHTAERVIREQRQEAK